jgi:hypothetical protein
LQNTRPLNQIIREHAFDESLAKIAKDYKRLDALDLAIDWALARDPAQFPKSKEDFYLWRMEQASDSIPPLLILYRFVAEEKTVYLINVVDVSKR